MSSVEPISLVPVEAHDFEALAMLRTEAMRESLERLGRFDSERAKERLRSGFDPRFTRHILVRGEQVGFVVVKPHQDGLLLDHLYLRPAAQRLGIGGAVLTQIFAEADAAGQPLRVGALRESASNRFYLRHGFEPAGESEWDLSTTFARRGRARRSESAKTPRSRAPPAAWNCP